MIPAPSFKIPRGVSVEQFLLQFIAEGDTDIRVESTPDKHRETK